MKTAIVTASYHADFDRFRLLCETLDAHVTGYTKHYVLVEDRDVPLFRQLQSPRRIVIGEKDLLPSWLKVFPDPMTMGRRRIWLSFRTKPLRGWHVQQFRRIAIADLVDDDAFLYLDSDVAFLRPYNCDQLWRNGNLRLLIRPNALAAESMDEHRLWSANAGTLLGLPESQLSTNDYVGTMIAWKRSSILDMCRRIETVTGEHWIAAMGKQRRFSECMMYGRFVDDVEKGAGHFHDQTELCKVFWLAPPPTEEEFRAFVRDMAPEQVALGMQSFLGLEPKDIRRVLGL
ncbi:MAG: DUF6492 family protein [Rhizobium sp.]|nr:DUF6492 family protein [Rhizobium sp.]MCZ8350738.1 DUF6492 family protein [Rhizobium sp.]